MRRFCVVNKARKFGGIYIYKIKGNNLLNVRVPPDILAMIQIVSINSAFITCFMLLLFGGVYLQTHTSLLPLWRLQRTRAHRMWRPRKPFVSSDRIEVQ